MTFSTKGVFLLIERRDVERMAALAHLHLKESDIQQITLELDSILEAVQALNLVVTDGVEPMNHAVPLENRMREDTEGRNFPVETATANGPHVVQGYFRVPRILEEE